MDFIDRLGRNAAASNYSGLNQKDRDRIRKIGFRRWFNETCDAQEKRIKKQRERSRAARTPKTRRKRAVGKR